MPGEVDEDALVEITTTIDRWVWVATLVGLALLVSPLLAVVFLDFPFFAVFLVPVVLILATAPAFHVETSGQYVTERSRDEVRDAFLGEHPPLLVAFWVLAEDIVTYENCVEFILDPGDESANVCYRATERSDGRIEALVYTREARISSQEFRFASDGLETRVFVTSTVAGGVAVTDLPRLLLTGRYEAEMLDMQGYELRDPSQTIRLRRPTFHSMLERLAGR